MNLLEKLAFYWNYPFVRYALIVGVLIALCSSLLGVTLVLKRFSFIGDGLSHVAFGGMAVATVLGMSDHMPLTLAVTVACAVLLLHTGQNTQIKGDAAIAMVSVGLCKGFVKSDSEYLIVEQHKHQNYNDGQPDAEPDL